VILDTDNDTVDDLLANFASIDSVAVKFSVNNVMLPSGSMALGTRSNRLSALLVRGDRGSCKRKAYTENEGVWDLQVVELLGLDAFSILSSLSCLSSLSFFSSRFSSSSLFRSSTVCC
jgi:hypothetical protein